MIRKTILFAVAGELRLHKDLTYGKLKRSSDLVVEEGEFVSLMLCEDKYPFRTIHTIFARRNGLYNLTIADDIRTETNSSLLGVATMFAKPGPESSQLYCDEKNPYFQIVVLETMKHKSE